MFVLTPALRASPTSPKPIRYPSPCAQPVIVRLSPSSSHFQCSATSGKRQRIRAAPGQLKHATARLFRGTTDCSCSPADRPGPGCSRWTVWMCELLRDAPARFWKFARVRITWGAFIDVRSANALPVGCRRCNPSRPANTASNGSGSCDGAAWEMIQALPAISTHGEMLVQKFFAKNGPSG